MIRQLDPDQLPPDYDNARTGQTSTPVQIQAEAKCPVACWVGKPCPPDCEW